MIRGTLTLLNRSIRGDALKPQAHFVRIGSVVVLLLLLFVAHFRSTYMTGPGLQFFHSMSLLGVALISLAGIGHFANSITEEKEEGTLGLLLVANISPLAILLGKSTNRVLSTVLIFAAQFPFALLAITLGGITISQITAAYVALAGYLFLIANLGLLCSVLARRSTEAAGLMTLGTLFVLGFAPALENTLRQLVLRNYVSPVATSWAESLEAFHLRFSITQQLQRIFEPNGSYAFLSEQLLFSLIAGGVCFSMAWLVFSRIVWAADVSEPRRIRLSVKPQRVQPWVSRPWKMAMAWKDFYFLSGGPILLIAKLCMYPVWIGFCVANSREIRRFTDVTGEQFARDGLLIVLCVEVLYLASQFMHSERLTGTLSTLLMLPKGIGQISYSKLIGCLINTVPIALAVVAAEWIMHRNSFGETVVFSQRMVVLLGLLVVLSHLTVLCSLIVKWGALPLAIGIVLVLGMVLGPFVAGAMNLISGADQGALAEVSPIVYTTGVVSAILQFEIARRISTLAAS